ncbi:MAG: DsrE family protein [bacterium]|nr:DsrE family protein [Betaproteobacteria bacterium]
MPAADFSDAVIVATNDGLGQGEPALARKVAATYFRTLLELEARPAAIVFYTAGVNLVADDSPCIGELRQLADAGVRLVACRTCLEHYGLMDRVGAGEIGNMAAILDLQATAARVITL